MREQANEYMARPRHKKYVVLDPEKFRYADKLRQRQRTKSGCNAIILVDCNTNLSLIPVDTQLTTPLVPRVKFGLVFIFHSPVVASVSPKTLGAKTEPSQK